MSAEPQTGTSATLACLMEATAAKPGNVHRGADFDDMTFLDLALSAVAIGPAMQSAVDQSLGDSILQAVTETRNAVGKNTNLGIVLLLAPLCKATIDGRSMTATDLRDSVADVLQRLTPHDARQTYEAIRIAQPGGLSRVDEADVHGKAPDNLLKAMRLAADHDLIALQYGNGFEDVFQVVLPSLSIGVERGIPLTLAVIQTQMELMARFPDSLIRRKCGMDVAKQSAVRANAVLESGPPDSEPWRRSLAELDFWLRSDGHRRNPGTTADMIAAGLFVGLRLGTFHPPFE